MRAHQGTYRHYVVRQYYQVRLSIFYEENRKISGYWILLSYMWNCTNKNGKEKEIKPLVSKITLTISKIIVHTSLFLENSLKVE